MFDPSTSSDHVESLIDPELRKEIGNPVPVTFAATVVYLPLLVGGVLLAVFWTKTIPGPVIPLSQLMTEIAVSTGVALALVGVTYLLARTLKPFEVLEREFRAILGHLSLREIVWIAILSGAAEEIVFRGAVQPWISGLWSEAAGLVVTSLVFGLLHYVPDRVFLPWTIFATAVGFICGGLYQVFDSVVAPVVTHTLLNAVNLALIVHGEPRSMPAR
jgi:membrane protease YdiL (CAAX protease family)